MPYHIIPITKDTAKNGSLSIPQRRNLSARTVTLEASAPGDQGPNILDDAFLVLQSVYADASILTTLGWQSYFSNVNTASAVFFYIDISLVQPSATQFAQGYAVLYGCGLRALIVASQMKSTVSSSVSSFAASATLKASTAAVFAESLGLDPFLSVGPMQAFFNASQAQDLNVGMLGNLTTAIQQTFAVLGQQWGQLPVLQLAIALPDSTSDGFNELTFLNSVASASHAIKSGYGEDDPRTTSQQFWPNKQLYPTSSWVIDQTYEAFGIEAGASPTGNQKGAAKSFMNNPASYDFVNT